MEAFALFKPYVTRDYTVRDSSDSSVLFVFVWRSQQFQAVFETRKMRSPEPLTVLRGVVECQQPIEDLYSFTGRIILNHQSIPPQFQVSMRSQMQRKQKRNNLCNFYNKLLQEKLQRNAVNEQGEIHRPLSADNVLLRGMRLKNTGFVYGMIQVYVIDCSFEYLDPFISVKETGLEFKHTRTKFVLAFTNILAVIVRCGHLHRSEHQNGTQFSWQTNESKYEYSVIAHSSWMI